MKRVFSVIFAFLIIIAIAQTVDIPVSAAESGDYTYEVSDGKATITGYTGSGSAITIPDSLDTYPVTAIGDSAFSWTDITSVVIGNNVTSIGNYAFSGCYYLTSVTIGNSVASVGDYAFDCDQLIQFSVDSNNMYYSSLDGVLFNKDQTTLLKYPAAKTDSYYAVPASVTTIGDHAFEWCSYLTSIEIGDSVASIGTNAFWGSVINYAWIGSNVNSIGDYAFSLCYSLVDISVDSSNTTYSSQNGVLFNYAKTTLVQYPAGKTDSSYVIRNSVTIVGVDAFAYNYYLTDITFGSGVTTIGEDAFYYCDALSSLTLPDNVKSIGVEAFGGCSGLPKIYIPNSVIDIGKWAFWGCTGAHDVFIESGVTNIGEEAFQDCTSLTQINVSSNNASYSSQNGVLFNKTKTELCQFPCGKTGSYIIPDSVTVIGSGAFNNCIGLTDLTIGNGVTSIADGAFSSCSGLISVTIGNNVTSIGDTAFFYLDGLTTVTIPSSVTSIGSYAFYGCASLTDAYFLGNAPTIGDCVFDYCADTFTIHYLSARTGYTNPWYTYVTEPFTAVTNVSYRCHVQNIGWQTWVSNGETAGTSGQSLRLEGINIKLDGLTGVEYRTHVQDYGWMNWVSDGALSGTSGESKRLEAIEIRLTGAAADIYDIYYRVHAQNFGWMGWAKNGESSGTAGYAYRLEAIQIVLVPKGESAPGSTENAFVDKNTLPKVSYRTHVQNVGWQPYVSNGETAGTSGQSLRLEGINIKLENIIGGIEYRTHVQDYGWMSWVADDAMSGTSGESKRLEAIEIRLTGAAADKYDVYYRVHAQNFGWLDWAMNGQSSGTAGFGFRLEAIQIVLVPKGGAAPGATTRPFVKA